MRDRKHFGKRGAFHCETCNGRTREGSSENPAICAECWEIAGYENSIQDGHETPGDVRAICEKEFLPRMRKRHGFSEEQYRHNFWIIYAPEGGRQP